MNAQEMAILEEYARQARELAEAIEVDSPPNLDPGVLAEVQKIKRLALQTEEKATSPVKIGVVGQFNAGKSLLLGGLVGFADGIPVKPIPTTGNVTCLHFLPSEDVEDVHTTRFEGFVVEFLDQEGARACLGEMLAEARRLAPESRFSEELVATLAGFKHEDKKSLTGFDSWCRAAWVDSENYAPMRFLLRELTWFIRAYLQCGEALCNPAQRYEISTEVAEKGLALEVPDEVRSLRFDDLPPAPRALSGPPDPAVVTAEFLRSVFPLIARVSVDVVIARGLWDLRPLRGTNEFVLLDFPGLGAAFSGLRDRFLCIRELREVQTILLLLNSEKPGEGGWGHVFTPLAQKLADFADCVLVGVSRFDCLPLTEQEKQWLKDAAELPAAPAPMAGWQQQSSTTRHKAVASYFDEDDDDPAPGATVNVAVATPPSPNGERLTEAAVLARVETLRAAVAVAECMVPTDRRDRVVFLSPMFYLKKLADEDSRLTVATPDFLPEIQRKGEAAAEVQQLWKAVAAKIRVDDPTAKSDGLTGWLERFATDGGIGALRILLASHVGKHGLGQLAREVEMSASSLRQALEQLPAQFPKTAGLAVPTTDPDRVQAVKEALRKLSDHYRMVATQVQQGLVLQAERDGIGVPVTRLIDEEAVFQIYAWPHWDNLLQSLRNGYVVEGTRTVGIPNEPDEPAGGGIDWEDDETFPTRGEDFFGVFEQTLSQLQEYTRAQIEAGVDYWLRQIGEAVASDRRELNRLLAAPGLPAEMKRLRLGKRNRGMLNVLKASVDPSQLKRFIFPEGEASRLEMERPVVASRVFPQPRSTPHDPGRIYGWSRRLREHPKPDYRPDPNLSHHAQVICLRDEFVTIVSQEMAQTVSLVLQKLNIKISEVLADLWQKLQRAEVHAAVVDTLVRGGPPPAPVEEDDPLVLVRKLTTLRWPLSL